MKLRLKTFEKSIHTKLRTLESSEWKKLRPSWSGHYQVPPWLVRFGFVAIATSILYNLISSIDTLVALILLLAAGTVFWRASQLLIALVSSARLQVFACLPLSNAQVFKLQWQGFLKNTSLSLIEFTAIYGVLAAKVGCGGSSLLAGLAMSIAQCLVIVALSTCLVAYLPRRRFDLLAWVFILPILGLIFGGFYFQPVFKWLASQAHWIPPTGWILYALGISRSQGFPGDLWPSLTTGLVLALLPKAYQHLRNHYALPENGLAAEKIRAKMNAREQAEASDDSARNNAITARIRNREFLAGIEWRKHGWLERLVSNWSTPEEQLAAEFLTAGKPNWTKGLIKISLIFTGVVFLIAIFPRFGVSQGILFGLLGYAGEVLFIKIWPGIAVRQIGGTGVPLYAIYPLGFRQIVRVVMKTNALRMMLLVPVISISFYLTSSTGAVGFKDIHKALGLGVKVTIAAFCLQPVFAIMSLSSGTNDTRSPKLLILFLVAMAVMLGCGVAFFLTQSVWLAAVLTIVLFGVSAGSMWLYGHAFNRNWFDLQSKPKDQQKAASP
jgi:hypothetical protein